MYRNYCEQLQQNRQQEKGQKKETKMSGMSSDEQAKLFAKLNEGKSDSLLKKKLTPELYEKLKDKKTKLGGCLGDCIKSGAMNLNSHVGLYACDPEAYTTFQELFDEVIKAYHKVDKVDHPKLNAGTKEQLEKLQNLDELAPGMIVSTRVRVGRSHVGIPFPPCISDEERKKAFDETKKATEGLKGDLEGKFYDLAGLTKEEKTQLVEDHFLFKDDDDMLRDAGGYKNWPNHRAIFHNPAKTFLIWVNEEDHLRFISMQKGGNIKETYLRLVTAIDELTKRLKFATKDNLGFLTFCPTNLGTAMRASVHIKIPKLSAQKDFKEFCEKLNLQPRGIHGENTESVGGVYDISNKRRLGLTEYDAIMEMQEGVKKIIEKEMSL